MTISGTSSWSDVAAPGGAAAGVIRAGVDRVELDEIRNTLQVVGKGFLERVYTPAEISFCAGRVERLATRFAAKEAVAKMLGTGFRGLGWREIEVLSSPHGEPHFLLHHRARDRARSTTTRWLPTSARWAASAGWSGSTATSSATTRRISPSSRGRCATAPGGQGLNPNVRKVRDDQDAYLQNILRQQHGSVLEHVSFTFVLHNVSRVFTHELVRHRPGTAVSQESLRYVRLDELPFWFPEWARQDAELMKRATALLTELEQFQQWMAGHFGLDDDETKMHEKKHKTSFMRRFAPEGLATGLVWTANIRTLRHTIEARTDQGAEEEIRLVFGKIGELMRAEAPALFGDYANRRHLGARLAQGMSGRAECLM